MWQTTVAPLFNAALALLYFEPSETQKKNLERLRRCSFKLAAYGPFLTFSERAIVQTKLRVSLKKFLCLPRSFSIQVLSEIFPIDFGRWFEVESSNACCKWEARITRTPVNKNHLKKFVLPRVRNLPKEFNKLLKCFVSWCGTCQKPFYPEHLVEYGIQRVRISELFEDFEMIRMNLLEEGRIPHRDVVLNAYANHLNVLLAEVRKVLKEHAQSF